MSGGGASRGVGHTPESVSGAERPEPTGPTEEDFVSKTDVATPYLNLDQMTVRSLFGIRATLMAALEQIETALLLNGVALHKSSPRRAAPDTGEDTTETHKLFGGQTVELPKSRGT